MSIKQAIQDDLKASMRNKDKARVNALRLITAAMKQREVDERIELEDSHMLEIFDKMGKQRRDSISQYQNAGRDDLVAQEQFELDILQEFMPQPLSSEEIAALIEEVVSSTGASSPKDMGNVMNALRPQVQGRVDMREVSGAVKKRLSQ